MADTTGLLPPEMERRLQESRERAQSQVETGEEDEVGKYERRARRYFNSYSMQFTVSGQMLPRGIWNLPGSEAIPGGAPQPKPPRSARTMAIRALGQQLLNAGYLRSTNAANDPNAVFGALVDMEEDMDTRFGYSDENKFLTDLIQTRGGIGEQKDEFTPKPFVKPTHEPMASEDLENAIEAGFTSVMGRRPDDEELHRFASEFRARERGEHTSEVRSARSIHGQKQDIARQIHEAEQGRGELPGEVTIAGPPVEQAPHPRSFTEEGLVDTDEAKAFHGARLGLDLLSALRGGF